LAYIKHIFIANTILIMACAEFNIKYKRRFKKKLYMFYRVTLMDLQNYRRVVA